MLHWDIVLIVDEAQSGQQQPRNSSALPRGTMYPSETVIHEQSGVGIYEREDRTQYQNGRLVLTSHRIVYKGVRGAVGVDGSPSPTQPPSSSSGIVNGLNNLYRNPFASSSAASPTPTGGSTPSPHVVADDDENAIFLPLSLISSATWARGFGSWSHPKITVLITTHPSTSSSASGMSGGGGGGLYYKFSFRQGGIDAFFAHLERTLQSKVWERKIHTHHPLQQSLSLLAQQQHAPTGGAHSRTPTQQVTTPPVGSQNTATASSVKSTTSTDNTFTISGHGSAGAAHAVGHAGVTTTANTNNTFSFPAATGSSAVSMVNTHNNNNNNNHYNIAPAARNGSNSNSNDTRNNVRGGGLGPTTTTNVSSSSLQPSSVSPPSSSNGARTATTATTTTTTTATTSSANSNSNNIVDDDNNTYITPPLPRIGIVRALRAREQRVEEAQAALAQHRQEALADADSLILNANNLINAIIALQNQAKQHRQQQGGEEEASSGHHGQGNHPAIKKENIISIDAALGDVRSVRTSMVGVSSSSAPHQGTPATFNQHSPSLRTPKGYNPLPLHESLAREILMWLTHPQNFLSRRFIIPLSELFSYYCKARSGESGVSTGDFLEAIIALTAISVKRAAAAAAGMSHSSSSRNSGTHNQVGKIQMDVVSAQAPQRPSSALAQDSHHQKLSFPMELVSDGKLFEGTISLTETFIKTVVSASASAPQRKEEAIKAINAISSSRSYQSSSSSQTTSSAEEKKNAVDRSIFKAMRNNDTMVKIVDSYLGGTVNSNINITTTSAGILNASRSLSTFSLSKSGNKGGHEDRNSSGWPLIACDDVSLTTLATFAAQTKRPSKNKTLSSQDSTSSSTTHEQRQGSEFYELKRYKNGSICLQIPCISDRIVDLLKRTLFESAEAMVNQEGAGGGGGSDSSLSAAGNYPNAEDIPSITASEFGTMLGVHTDIAEEVLATLELAGVLCRDEHNTLAPTAAAQKERKNGSHNKSSHHVAAGVAGSSCILSVGKGLVDDATLTALWTTPLFAETSSSTSRKNGFKKANARWTWNWFFPEIFSA